jgi:predicted RNase H-like HicB family nuclease
MTVIHGLIACVSPPSSSRANGTFPNLPGCVSVGDALDEVKAEIPEAIEFHIEGLREDSTPIPPPSTWAEYVDVEEQAAA